MYSGSTFRTKSGRMMGVHQKIDRVAHRGVMQLIPSSIVFPSKRDILHFEGKNGPDGIKRKSPGVDEPWHFIDPYHEGDHNFFDMLTDHLENLTVSLREGNYERSSFEAAWFAHAIVDGLTPAHHYPLENKLEELRGEGLETRNSKKEKLVMPGDTRRRQLQNNWEFWGTKGVMTTHLAFEFGIASTIATVRFDDVQPTKQQISEVEGVGFLSVYQQILQSVAELNMYEDFSRSGWTRTLANETKQVLLPQIINAVVLGWYSAVFAAVGHR
jgi:hypothetical protein